jgi:hypothetical protein
MSTRTTTRSFAQLTDLVNASLTLGEDSNFDKKWWETFLPLMVYRNVRIVLWLLLTGVGRFTDPVA